MIQRIAKVLGGVLLFGGCLPMVAVLPGAMATGLGALGIRATSGPFESLARSLAPVAQPLLIVGLLLLVVAALRCSWAATAIVLVGGVLLYAACTDCRGWGAQAARVTQVWAT